MKIIAPTSASGILQMLFGMTAWIGLFRILSMFGSAALAGYTIAIRIVIFTLMPAWGLANAGATLPNKDGALRAGTFMSVNLMSKVRNSLSIPEIAVIAEGSETYAFVVDQTRQPAVAMKTKLELGVREKGFVEVLSGLKTGDMVVTDGVLKLRPNAPVRIKGGAGAAGAPPPGREGAEKMASGEGPSDRAGLRQ